MMENKSFLMICTINELFSTVLKKQSDGELKFDLKDSFLLVCSRDIVTENKKLASYDSYSNEYQSKYKNVDFIPSLIPSASQMEYLGCGDRDTFIDQYTERLYGEAQMKDIVSICDVVVNRQMPIIIVTSSMDMKQCLYPYILQEFLKDEMGIKAYMLEDIHDDNWDDIFDVGDTEVIKKNIETKKDEILKNTDVEYFFNTLVDDMEKAYREILSTKSIEELKGIAKENLVFISRRDDKDRIIEKIINDMIESGK